MARYPKIACRFLLAALLFLETAVGVKATDSQIKGASFDPDFGPALLSVPRFITGGGGAQVIEFKGNRYFVAIGVTEVVGDSPQESIRQIRVGRVLALKAAVEFINATTISSEETLKENTTVIDSNGKKTGTSTKTLDETTVAQIKGVLKAPPEVGSWKSSDGTLYYFAVGIKLDNDKK